MTTEFWEILFIIRLNKNKKNFAELQTFAEFFCQHYMLTFSLLYLLWFVGSSSWMIQAKEEFFFYKQTSSACRCP